MGYDLWMDATDMPPSLRPGNPVRFEAQILSEPGVGSYGPRHPQPYPRLAAAMLGWSRSRRMRWAGSRGAVATAAKRRIGMRGSPGGGTD